MCTNAGNNVDCKSPIIHETTNVQKRQQHAQQDPKTSLYLGYQKRSGGHNANQGEHQVTHHLFRYHLIGHPGGKYFTPHYD